MTYFIHLRESILNFSTIDNLLLIVIISIVYALLMILKKYSCQFRGHIAYQWLEFILAVMTKPFIFILTAFMFLLLSQVLVIYSHIPYKIQIYFQIFSIDVFKLIFLCWMMINFVKLGTHRLLIWSSQSSKTLNIIIPAITTSLYIFLFLIMINIFLGLVNLPMDVQYIIQKIIKVFIIGMIGVVFIQIIQAIEKFILNQYVTANADDLTARKIHTQLILLKRVLIIMVVLLTFSTILMLFDSFKNLGTGLLTTAGIVSAVGAFASQQSLSRLFSGLLIAFTQPIRIGDTVIIDNEFGQIEEITLSYIVVKLWDLRRLIIPTDHVTNKGLQNLSRQSSELLGTVFLYADYTLPVDAIRVKFNELLQASALWDKKVAAFQVTDITQTCMQIRALVSAANSSHLWELRCQIREQLIDYIVKYFPDCLAKSRSITHSIKSSSLTE